MAKIKVKMDVLNCSICGEKILENPITGWDLGNNAEPVATGRCCDHCNETEVLPQRLRNAFSLTEMVGIRGAQYMELDNPFKPNTSRVDHLETQIRILQERVAKLERDLTYFIKETACKQNTSGVKECQINLHKKLLMRK